MANPRNTVSHDENHARYETFKHDNSTITYDRTAARGSAVAGRAVKLSADDTVALAGDGDVIYGRLDHVEDSLICVVQIGGFCELPAGNAATVTVGTKIVGALNASSAAGFIKTLAETVSASPSQAEVQNVLKAAKTKGLIVNNDTTTAVVVDLG